MASTPPHDDDPTFVRNQPSLTQSSGRIWLISGAILTVVALVILGLLVELDAGLAWLGITLCVALYAAMVVIRVAVHSPRLRLGLLAAAMLGIAITALSVIAVIGSNQLPLFGP